MIAVAFPVHNRPDLLGRVLDGWAKVRGAQDAVFVFCCEPGCDDAVDLCKAVDWADCHVTVNDGTLGHAWNTFKSMQAAFGLADYAVQANDDYLPATNVLELHAWHRENYLTDGSVLALSASRDVPAPDGGFGAVWRCQLIGAMSGFHRHKWAQLAGRWQDGTGNWWRWVNEQWLQSGPCLDVLFPAVSYAKALDEPDAVNACFVPDPPPQDYREVSGWRERARGFTRWYEITG